MKTFITKNLTTSVFLLLFLVSGYGQSVPKYTISGHIKDKATGEELIGANLITKETAIGNTTNVYGFYSLTLPEGMHEITYSYLGYENLTITIDLQSNLTQNIELDYAANLISEVTIVAEDKNSNVTTTGMSSIKLNVTDIKKIPALFGEIDIIRAIQLLPGVKSMGEASSGFYVRGGNADQNLVLLDEAPIYNASHLLGFFSSFNPDAIKDMQLYKGAISSKYGGRLSSVLDIRMKDGNSKSFGGSGGIGTMMSRLALEAPLGENGSLMLAGRRSYLDVLAKTYQGLKSGEPSDDDQQFYFYDLNTKANYRLGDKDRVFLSGYFGRDVFNASSEGINIGYGNKTATVRWNHLFSPKLFSNLTYYYSNYDYKLGFDDDITDFTWLSRLAEFSFKADLTAYVSPVNTIEFGLQSIRHSLDPGDIEVFENDSLAQTFKIQNAKSLENAIYATNKWKVNDQLTIDAGLRFSSLHNLGPQKQTNLDSTYEVVDTTDFDKGIYHSYYNLEPRIGLKYLFDQKQSIKASYNRTAQYIQQASNGNTATPFDIWFVSSPQVQPQLADQFAIGYFRNFRDNAFEFSAEVYYKKFSDAIDFKERAQLLLNDNLEGELRKGEARAFGAEFMLRKNLGKSTGWISYSYSKVEKQITDINNGQWYNAKYDKPHDVSIVVSHELSDRVTLGGNFLYSSGSAVTFPTGRYTYKGQIIPVYSERNGERLPDFHRLDFSLTLQSKKNNDRRLQSEWVFGIYNVYNRKNAFAINFKQEEDRPQVTYAEKSSIFSIVPSVTYNAKF